MQQCPPDVRIDFVRQIAERIFYTMGGDYLSTFENELIFLGKGFPQGSAGKIHFRAKCKIIVGTQSDC